MGNSRRPPSRAKVVWAFGQLLHYLERYINTSAFIATTDKDKLVASLEGAFAALRDAETRASGKVPLPLSAQKEMERKRKERERPA